MQTKFILISLVCLLCSACSVSVAPIATPTGIINQEENSLTETAGGITFTVKLDEMSVASYPTVDNISSFHVVIENGTEQQVSYPPNAFFAKGWRWSAISLN